MLWIQGEINSIVFAVFCIVKKHNQIPTESNEISKDECQNVQNIDCNIIYINAFN